MNRIISASEALTRRSFLSHTSKTVAGVAALSALPIERFAHAASPGETLKIALVGCGGRGSGAANQALSTGENVQLVAVADIHKDRMDGSLSGLAKQHKDKVKVAEDHKFVGFEAYKQAIATADVVILATPPGFRPETAFVTLGPVAEDYEVFLNGRRVGSVGSVNGGPSPVARSFPRPSAGGGAAAQSRPRWPARRRRTARSRSS